MRFRRRLLGRRIARPGQIRFRRRLRQAHRWLAVGRAADAAQRFDELAETALDADRPIASQLFIQAGRAYLAAGQIALAQSLLLRGIRLMIGQGDPRLAPVGRRVTSELRQAGHSDLAEALETLLPPGVSLSSAEAASSPPLALPPKCPYCGGNVHADQVDQTDPERPACAYCGSPLVGGEPPDV